MRFVLWVTGSHQNQTWTSFFLLFLSCVCSTPSDTWMSSCYLEIADASTRRKKENQPKPRVQRSVLKDIPSKCENLRKNKKTKNGFLLITRWSGIYKIAVIFFLTQDCVCVCVQRLFLCSLPLYFFNGGIHRRRAAFLPSYLCGKSIRIFTGNDNDDWHPRWWGLAKMSPKKRKLSTRFL